MASLPLLILATLLATTTATNSISLPPEGIPVEQPGCSDNVVVNQGLIIDIKASVNFGAELLNGEVQDTFSACVTTCCGMERCDMALYKQNGFSKSGKNCYYIHCGVPANCRMLEHEGFVSATLIGGGDNQIGQGRENNNGDVMAPYTSTPPLPPPTPPTQPVAEEETTPTIGEPPEGTATPATEDLSPDPNGEEGPVVVVPVPTVEDSGTQTPDSDTTATIATDSDTTTTIATDSDSTATPDSDTNTTSDPDTTAASDPDSVPTSDSNAEELETSESQLAESELELSESKSNQPGTKNGNETAEERASVSVNTDSKHGCDQHGCDGRALIFVALIGTTWILILVVLAVVVMKKLRDRRRKERFHNVDYLINGMYA